MIEALLDLARRRVAGGRDGGGADALWRRAERTSVSFEWGRLKSAGATEETGINLRVRHRGRVGVAGMTGIVGDDVGAQHAAALHDRAVASAELGEEIELAFPSRAPLPQVPTFFDRAADTLPREDRRSMVAAEIMASIYRGLLRRMELDKFRVFEKEYGLNKLEKTGRIAAQLLKLF